MTSGGTPPEPGAVAPPPGDQEWHAPHNPWIITLVATISTFMEVLDTTIVNVALPHIAGSLGADVNDSTWVLTSYLVSNAVILPTSAYFSSLIGRRNFYMICVALFSTASLMCGLAPSLMTLVMFRLLQGIGGGGLQPSTQSILVDTFPPYRRGMGMAVFGMAVVAAPVIGPTLGGWITDNYSWRWIFFINIPVGILSLLLTPLYISDPPYFVRRKGRQRYSFDYIGLGLVALGLASLQIVLDMGDRKGWWDSTFIRVFTFTCVFGLAAAIIWELRHRDPIVNLRLLGERNLGMSSLIMLLFGSTLYGSTMLLPLFMQTLLGYTALLSGLAISPGGIVIFLLMPLVGWLTSHYDARWLITFGIIVIAISLHEMGRFSLEIDFRTLVLARILQSAGMAFIFVPSNTIAYAFVAKEMRNGASSLISVTRNIGGSVGIALATSMITRRSQVHQVYLSANVSPYDPQTASFLKQAARLFSTVTSDPVQAMHQAYAAIYGAVLQQARTLAFVDAFRMFAIIALIVIPFVWFMKRAPAHMVTPGTE
jgi:DHA2 family multidrug resistance protein